MSKYIYLDSVGTTIDPNTKLCYPTFADNKPDLDSPTDLDPTDGCQQDWFMYLSDEDLATVNTLLNDSQREYLKDMRERLHKEYS